MELKNYLEILIRRKWIVIVTLFVTLIVALIGWAAIPQNRTAEATLRIDLVFSEDSPFTQLAYAERIMNTYARIAASESVLKEMREQLGLSSNQPADIDVSLIPDTNLLQIVAEDPVPVIAWDSVLTIVDILVNEELDEEIVVSIVDPPTLLAPSSLTNVMSFAVLAIVVGISGGIGLAFFIDYLDDRVYTMEQVQAVTELPIVGEIPVTENISSNALEQPSPIYDDAFRRLRYSIEAIYPEKALTTLMITSAAPEAGKSTIAVSLARALAQAGKHTLLIDTDLYHPTVHRLLGIQNDVGLIDALDKGKTLAEVLQESEISGLTVVTSGSLISNPAELFDSKQMLALLDEASEQYDSVIVDSPAYLGVAGVAALAPAVDGVLLVVRQDTAKRSELVATCRQLIHVNANLIGIVVNRVKKSLPRGYQRYYSAPATERSKPELSADQDGEFKEAMPNTSTEYQHAA